MGEYNITQDLELQILFLSDSLIGGTRSYATEVICFDDFQWRILGNAGVVSSKAIDHGKVNYLLLIFDETLARQVGQSLGYVSQTGLPKHFGESYGSIKLMGNIIQDSSMSTLPELT